ncbi:MAG: hypothetical protein ACRC92_11315 [Peptostreptococcaceae bacterium]
MWMNKEDILVLLKVRPWMILNSDFQQELIELNMDDNELAWIYQNISTMIIDILMAEKQNVVINIHREFGLTLKGLMSLDQLLTFNGSNGVYKLNQMKFYFTAIDRISEVYKIETILKSINNGANINGTQLESILNVISSVINVLDNKILNNDDNKNLLYTLDRILNALNLLISMDDYDSVNILDYYASIVSSMLDSLEYGGE